MSAGVVSYQLCDRMFDCDNCPMDQAIRKRFSAPSARKEEDVILASHAMPQEIPEQGFYFSRSHWWVHQTGPRQFRLGIEAGLAQALQGVKGIVFPAPQQHVRGGQACVWVVMDGGTVPLEAPIDGVVRTVNYGLTSQPHLLRTQPFEEGWFFELEADEEDTVATDLMSAEEARPRFRSDLTRFLAALTGAVRGKRPSIGPTLNDGGERLESFVDILGPTRYLALIRQHLGGNAKKY
jgi:glycine cleavage system H protein